MSKGMKIFRGFMLTILLALCAAVAVIFIMQLRGGGNNNANVSISRSSTIDSEEPEEPGNIGFVSMEDEDYRFWQRAMSQQEETGLWQFYPIIPYDVMPGETAVLSVSMINFMGWEVDPNFADVELFDKATDEVNAYASFIMPEEEVSIAALYTEIPYINYENQQYMRSSNYEFGEAPFTPFSTGNITPIPGATVQLPDAIQGQFYNITLTDPDNVPAGRSVTWIMNETPGDPTALPEGLSWQPTPDTGGCAIYGYPLLNLDLYGNNIPYEFSATLNYSDTGTFFGIVMFRLEVLEPETPPQFITTTVPDGMIEVPYNVYIETQYMDLPNVTWTWAVLNILDLPPGITVRQDPADQTRGLITGVPTAAGTYEFDVRASNPRPAVPNVTVTYIITVWEKPVITPAVPAPGAGGPTLPLLYDGIANVGSVVKDYNVTLNAASPMGSDAITAFPGWTWEISPDSVDPLPAGLGFSSRTNNSVAISGNPSAAETRTFTVLYKADQSVLRGWVEVTYTITIQAPPQFFTGYNDLKEGMHSVPRFTGNEPPDAPYHDTITVVGFTTDLRTDWDNWSYSGDFPQGQLSAPMELKSVDETFAVITGMPVEGTNLDYDFIIAITAVSTNPNINGAVVSAPYRIRIWPRTYLFIDYRNTDRFVRRLPGVGEAADVADAVWNSTTFNDSNYESRRAVMPGREGEIRLPLGALRWMRWEVRTDLDPVLEPNANDYVGIFGPDRYDAAPGSANAFLRVKMPSFNGTALVAGDVYIRGIDARRPVWTPRLNDGMVGDESSSGFVTFNAADVGAGPDQISWDSQPVSGQIPPGMFFAFGNNNIATLMSDAGGPLIDGDFTFTLAINLPGRMKVYSPSLTMTIDPIPGIMLGDVNGDGQRNLADLVLLARFIRGEVDSLPNQEAGNIVSKPPARPNGSDLDILAIFFARPEASLPVPPPPTPEP